MTANSSSLTAFATYGTLKAQLSEASRVLSAARSGENVSAAVEKALAAVESAAQLAFELYEALSPADPALEVPAADASLVQHVVSSLSDSTIELEQSAALCFARGNNFISFGYLQIENPLGFARSFELLTRRSDARGLYLRECVDGAQLVELLTEHRFSIFEYMSLRPLEWREGQLRAAREYVRRKLKSLAPAAAAQPA